MRRRRTSDTTFLSPRRSYRHSSANCRTRRKPQPPQRASESSSAGRTRRCATGIEREPVVRDLELCLAIARCRAEVDRVRRHGARRRIRRCSSATRPRRGRGGRCCSASSPAPSASPRSHSLASPTAARLFASVNRCVAAGRALRREPLGPSGPGSSGAERAAGGIEVADDRNERVDPGGLEDLPTHPGGTDQDHLAASLRLGARGGEEHANSDGGDGGHPGQVDREPAGGGRGAIRELLLDLFGCPQGPAGRRGRSWSGSPSQVFLSHVHSRSPLCLARNPAGPCRGSGSGPRNRVQ